MTKPSRIIEEIHETVQGLHAGGLIDERRMREFEALYRANQVPKFNADSVKALRSRLNVSQAALAIINQYQCLYCARLGGRNEKPRRAFVQTAGNFG